MNPTYPQDESSLVDQLEESRKRLDALATELHAIDAELEEFGVERNRYALLEDVCGSLEKLDESESAHLFWEGVAEEHAAQMHMRNVRERIDAFQQQINQLDATRQAVVAKIGREQDEGELVAHDLEDLKIAEEERQHEWVVERDPDDLPTRATVMPWSRGGEDEKRLRKSLALALLLSMLLGVIFPWIPLPVQEHWELMELPDRFTSLIREEQITPPPVQELLPETREEELKPTEEETLVAEEGKPEPAATPDEIKPGAGAKGILAFREKFSNLADSGAAAKLGSQAQITRAGELATGRATRSLVTTSGPGSSGGIDIAALSRDVGGGGGDGIEGVQTARATSSIGAIGGGSDRPLSGGPGSSRTDEEIQIVFDRHKAALYRLYNRELRRDPTLRGQMVLRMTIEPDGSVSLCELKSSDMKAPNLAAQVTERVKTFDFGAKDGIPAITIVYPIDFLPAV